VRLTFSRIMSSSTPQPGTFRRSDSERASDFYPEVFAEWAAKAIQCATTGLYDEESHF